MPQTRKKAASPKKKAAAPRRKNPTRRKAPAVAKHRRRNGSPRVARAGSLAAEGITALVALVATRQLPQVLLGANNANWMGYAANVATTLLVAYAAKKVAGPRAANAALIGGTSYTVSRVLTEQFSPIGQYLSLTGVGDAAAATNLGMLEDAYFAYPTAYDDRGKPVIPREIVQAAQAGMMAQQQPQGISGIGRYNAY